MCVYDVHVFDINTDSYDGRHPHRILPQHKRHKKGKYIEACLEKQRHFTLLVLYVDGVMGYDKNEEPKKLSASLLTKWDR